jgi:predicted transport protein
VVPQKHRLRLTLNMHFDEIDDPKGMCKDVTNLGRWGNGDVEASFSSPDQLEYIMSLIRQAFAKHSDAEDD